MALFKRNIKINEQEFWWVAAEGYLAAGLDQLGGFDFVDQVGVFAVL